MHDMGTMGPVVPNDGWYLRMVTAKPVCLCLAHPQGEPLPVINVAITVTPYK